MATLDLRLRGQDNDPDIKKKAEGRYLDWKVLGIFKK